MSDEKLHEWHLIGPITLTLTADAFNLVHEEYVRLFNQSPLFPKPPFPKADDILSAVLNRLAADLKNQAAPPPCPVCGYRH